MTEKQGTSSQGTPTESTDSAADESGRVPKPAIWVVAVGLALSAIIYGISFLPGSGSVSIQWDTTQPLKSAQQENVGSGTFSLGRTSLAALAPNDEGILIYRVAGVIRVDSGGRKPTSVRCNVRSTSDSSTRIARSTKLRAAWPRPSDKLQAQAMPETSLVKFDLSGKSKVDLPIRDVANVYTNSAAETLVFWDGYTEDIQKWEWKMNEGTGPGAATLPWMVIFEAEDRPKGMIDCSARIGTDRTEVKIPFRLKEWPIADDESNVSDSESGDATDVE